MWIKSESFFRFFFSMKKETINSYFTILAGSFLFCATERMWIKSESFFRFFFSMKKETINSYFTILAGSFLFCAGLNWFIVPLGLYNGGTVGISQIIRTLLDLNVDFDIAGILNFLLNIPLLMLAFFF